MSRPTQYNPENLIYFDDNHEGLIIKELSMGMSMDEVCDYFGTPDPKALSVNHPDDFLFLKHYFRMGRASGNQKAVAAMFDQMKQRGGGQVALSYLSRFADDWAAEVEADSETKGRKSFKVVFD